LLRLGSVRDASKRTVVELSQKSGEGFAGSGLPVGWNGALHTDYEIQCRQLIRLAAENFPYETLDRVPCHGRVHNPLTDDNAKPRAGPGRRPGTHPEVLAFHLPSALERGSEVRSLPDPPRSRQALPVFAGRQTASRALPLARRALTTAWPPRFFIRTRNPWVRLRRVLDG
jgi:hypothetical protein